MGALAVACGAELATPPSPPVPLETTAAPPVLEPALVQGPRYRDDDFVESERNRDPFRPARARAETPPPVGPRAHGAATIEQLHLIATVSGIAQPAAMLADERGEGQTIRRGDFVGRPERVSLADDVSVWLSWRVDRIDHDRVVLVRTDPYGGAVTSRVLPLRTS
jgi:hypothetical protein